MLDSAWFVLLIAILKKRKIMYFSTYIRLTNCLQKTILLVENGEYVMRGNKTRDSLITIELKVGIKISEEGKWFISYCPAFDITSQGSTLEEAKEMIVDAIELFISSCYERGTLESVLRDCGWKPIKRSLTEKHKHISKTPYDYDVTIPFPFIIPEIQNSSRCHQ